MAPATHWDELLQALFTLYSETRGLQHVCFYCFCVLSSTVRSIRAQHFSVKTVSGSKKCNGNDTCKHIAVNESRVISLIQRGC